MNFANFFITRPIFAGVLSSIILIAGLIALPGLPISEYPEVVPPTVIVKATYPGANPEVIAETVAAPLEQAINGVENMMYQSSQATADGVMTLTITFALGADVDKAQVLVQNRVAQALPKLPEDVQRLGVTTNKASPDLTMLVHLVSPHARYDMLYLSNYATLHIKDELARLGGVGEVQIFGAGNYSMRVMHYNGFLTAEISGGPAPGYSSGQAQKLMEDLARSELPNGMDFEWTELIYQKILSGNTMVFVFPLVVLLVFLVLAAQYESLTLPLAVILIMPMVLLSAIAGVKLSGGDNNIFTQISLIVLVGLASKNAILIVEFARTAELAGASPLRAAHLRLRPILMTSFAFIMGVVPLVTSSGAGAETRHAMGIAVFSGMLGVTFFGLVLTPIFYLLVRRGPARRTGRSAALYNPGGTASTLNVR